MPAIVLAASWRWIVVYALLRFSGQKAGSIDTGIRIEFKERKRLVGPVEAREFSAAGEQV